MSQKFSDVSPATKDKRYRRNSARFRALSRLKMRHPEEFEELFREELAEGPIFEADRRTLRIGEISGRRITGDSERLPQAPFDGEGLAA